MAYIKEYGESDLCIFVNSKENFAKKISQTEKTGKIPEECEKVIHNIVTSYYENSRDDEDIPCYCVYVIKMTPIGVMIYISEGTGDSSHNKYIKEALNELKETGVENFRDINLDEYTDLLGCHDDENDGRDTDASEYGSPYDKNITGEKYDAISDVYYRVTISDLLDIIIDPHTYKLYSHKNGYVINGPENHVLDEWFKKQDRPVGELKDETKMLRGIYKNMKKRSC